ncbi:MAG: type II secretion system major pseudopilin GspG [Chthoniobacter sp.]|nr:type II secretion system major pseudopilin GspG [Chthoniobacter sp.]
MKKSHRQSSGFTLLEIMLVVCIIGLLIGMGVKMMGSKIDDAKIVAARGGVEGFKTKLLMYQNYCGVLPSTEQGLKALVTKPEGARNWRPQAEAGELVDPWNKEYLYVQPGTHNTKSYDVFSSGPDMQPNTSDDIGNWDSKD